MVLKDLYDDLNDKIDLTPFVQRENILKQEFKKKLYTIILLFSFIIIFMLGIIIYLYNKKNYIACDVPAELKNKSKIKESDEYLKYSFTGIDQLSFWGQALFYKDIKTLLKIEDSEEFINKYISIWKNFVDNKDLDDFKKNYINFWGINLNFDNKNGN